MHSKSSRTPAVPEESIPEPDSTGPEIAERANIYLSCLSMCLNVNNRAAIKYMINPSGESSMKHLESAIFWLSYDHVKNGQVKFVEYAPADMFANNETKIQE